MPPGMTICPVTSITRAPDSADSAPAAATAAIVSPAIATSQRTTPCGVTTSPPRMMRSSITPPGARKAPSLSLPRSRGRVGWGAWALVLAQALIDAVFVRVHAGDEPAGLQAIGKPCEARPRYFGSARPKARIPVAPKRARQNVTRDIGVEWRDRIRQLLRAVLGEPGQHAARRPDHSGKRRTVAANAVARGKERRIDGRSSGAGRVEDVARPRPQCHRRIRLEHLCHVERAAAQRRQVVRHRSVGYSIELRRIDTLLAQVVLQAQPGRRHFRHGRYLQTRQISQPKAIDFADEKERIARNDFAKANERRIGVEVAGLHHPHRSAPREVDRSVKQTRSRGSRRRRVEQVYFDALAGIESESVRGVEWRVEHRAKILGELDPHGRRYPMAAMSGSDGGILSVRGAF